MATKRLTAAGCENAKPGEKRIYLWDGVVPGFALILQPTGKRSWALWYRLHGFKARLTLGKYRPTEKGEETASGKKALPKIGAALTLGEARQLARWALAEVAEGRDPAVERKADVRSARTGKDLFVAVARDFIERYSRPKNRSWREQAAFLGLRAPTGQDEAWETIKGSPADVWKRRRMRDITEADVLDLLDGIVACGTPIMANRTRAHLAKLFRWSVERRIIATSPCVGIKNPAPERARDRVLDDAELADVWRAAEGLGFPFGPIVQLLILTGQRREEVAGMVWREVDLDGRLWTLPRERMKKDRVHEVPLAATAAALLEGLPRLESCGFAFSTNAKTRPSGFSRAKRRLDAAILEAARESDSKAEPMPHWTLHDIRRSVASGMARLGEPVHIVEKILAHQSGTYRGVVGTYQRHEYGPERRAALDRWAAHVEALTTDKQAAKVLPLRRKKAE